ncbi:uncharacterized protein LOC144475475 [Augochlora pura]
MMCDRACNQALQESVILKVYNASDHLYVRHTFKWEDLKNKQGLTANKISRKIDICKFTKKYEEWTNTNSTNNINSREEIDKYILDIGRIVSKSTKTPHPAFEHKNAVWWWTKEIAHARNDVIKARRRFQRGRGKNNDFNSITMLLNDYKEKKKRLKIEIKKAKAAAWEQFINTIDNDPWGKPYRWVMDKIKGRPPPAVLGDEELEEVVKKLFIIYPSKDNKNPDNNKKWNQTSAQKRSLRQ